METIENKRKKGEAGYWMVSACFLTKPDTPLFPKNSNHTESLEFFFTHNEE